LTTQEEKSMGAYAKSGASRIAGLLKPGDVPPPNSNAPNSNGGLYLLDVVPDGPVRFGFPISTTPRKSPNLSRAVRTSFCFLQV
jgi:altronate hydrolase